MSKEKYEVGLIFKAFDKVTGPLKQINSSLGKMNAPMRKFNTAFTDFGHASGVTRVVTSLKNVGSQLSSLSRKFIIFGGIASAVIGKGISSTIEWASNIHDLSAATGLSTSSIQGLGFALSQAGGSQQDLEAGAKKFSLALAEARKKGAGPLVDALKKVDPSGLKEILKSKDSGQGLRLFISSLSKFKSDPGRFSAAYKVLGKSAAKSFAVLGKEGPESLAKAESSINIFTDDQINQLEATGDAAGGVFEQLKNISRTFVFAAGPALQSFFTGLSNSISANKEQINQWAADFGAKLPARLESLKNSFSKLWENLKPIRDFFAWIAADSDRLTAAFTILGAIVAGPLIASLLSLSGAIISFVAIISGPVMTAIAALSGAIIELGIALLTTPVGWMTLAILGMVGAVYLIYEALKGTGPLFSAFFKDLITPFQSFWDLLTAIGDFLELGPIRRYLGGEDPWKKFKEIRNPYGGNFKKAWDQNRQSTTDSSQPETSSVLADLRKQFSSQENGFYGFSGEQTSNQVDQIVPNITSDLVTPQVITRDSEITIRFDNAPTRLRANITKNDGNRLKIELPLGIQSVGRPA